MSFVVKTELCYSFTNAGVDGILKMAYAVCEDIKNAITKYA